MKTISGILAISFLSSGAFAGSVGSTNSVLMDLNGRITCETIDHFTGYMETKRDEVTLNLKDSKLKELTLLEHSHAIGRGKVGLCQKIASLSEKEQKLQVDVTVSSYKNSETDKTEIYEQITLALPAGIELHSYESLVGN